MWIEETKNGKFKAVERYEDYLTGKTKRVSVTIEKNTAQSRKMAQAALNDKIKAIVTKTPTPQKEYTLQELVRAFLTEKEKELKQSTLTSYKMQTMQLINILGADSVANRMTANYVKSAFLATGKEAITLNSYLSVYISLIRWGYKRDIIKDVSYLNKLERIKEPSRKKKLKDKFLESAEIPVLLKAIEKEHWQYLTRFLLLSGLRFGEAAALETSDLDLKNRSIIVSKNYDIKNNIITLPKTTESFREVYMQDELLSLCRELKRNALQQKLLCGCGLIFQRKATHIDYTAYYVYLTAKSEASLGRKITPHALRHTHASLLMEQGIQIEEISRRLGHENSDITREIYLHVTQKLKEQEQERMRKIKII